MLPGDLLDADAGRWLQLPDRVDVLEEQGRGDGQLGDEPAVEDGVEVRQVVAERAEQVAAVLRQEGVLAAVQLDVPLQLRRRPAFRWTCATACAC